jgi:mannose-6-phosphate isomerase-like protein (cupin superfamily)
MDRKPANAIAILAMAPFISAFAADANDDYKVVTIIPDAVLEEAARTAPPGEVSDQAIRHVSSAAGNLGIGIVHRPIIKKGGPVTAIRHHHQSEVYRVISGSGTLVTSASLAEPRPLDADGFIVKNLTGPSDRGVIDAADDSQLIAAGDVVIIPAGVAHGFSEITAAITYLVVRVDPDRRVALK